MCQGLVGGDDAGADALGFDWGILVEVVHATFGWAYLAFRVFANFIGGGTGMLKPVFLRVRTRRVCNSEKKG